MAIAHRPPPPLLLSITQIALLDAVSPTLVVPATGNCRPARPSNQQPWPWPPMPLLTPWPLVSGTVEKVQMLALMVFTHRRLPFLLSRDGGFDTAAAEISHL